MLDIFTATNTKLKKIKYKFKILISSIELHNKQPIQKYQIKFQNNEIPKSACVFLKFKNFKYRIYDTVRIFFFKMFVLIADITFHYSFKISYKSLKQCSGKNYNTTSHNAKYKFAVLIIFAIKATLRVLKCQIQR